MSNPSPPRPEIHVRHEQLEKYRAIARITTGAALAARMGVHPDTVHRTLDGRTQLSVSFIEALLGAFPELTFGDLFAVEYPAELHHTEPRAANVA